MKEFNSMSELMLYMLRSNIPEKLKSSVSERMKAVEECNDGGASAVLIIAHSKAEVEEVEAAGAPGVLHGSAQREVADVGNDQEEHIGVGGEGGENKAHQTPDFTLQNAIPVEAEDVIKGEILIGKAQNIHQRIAQNDEKHQVGNALFIVLETETFETGTQIFQRDQLLFSGKSIVSHLQKKSTA